MKRFVLCALLLSACGGDEGPAATPGEQEEAPRAPAQHDILLLPRSEISMRPVAVTGAGSAGAASNLQASQVAASDVRVQQVLTEFNARQTAEGVVLTLPESILFDFDQADLQANAQLALTKIADVLKAYAQSPIRIVGHTDSKGEAAYNQTLSERRAEAVRVYLTQTLGVEAARVTAQGRGAAQPVVPNERNGQDDPAGRQRNRRVEVVVAGAQLTAPGSGTTPPGAGPPTSTLRPSGQ